MRIKKLLRTLGIFILVLAWFLSGKLPIFRIQEAQAAVAAVSATPAGKVNTTAGTTCANTATAGFGTATTQTIVIVVSTAAAKNSSITVSDNATGGTNTYTKIVSENSSGGYDYLFYSVNIPRVNASGLVVTASWTTSARNSCAFKAYTGVVSAAAATTSTGTNTSTTTPTIATVTVSANSWIVSGFSAANGSTTVSARSGYGTLDASAASTGSTTPSTGLVSQTTATQGNTVTNGLTWGTARTSGQTALELRSDLILPTMSPNGGSYNNDTAWTMSDTDSGVTFCWRTDGTNPAATTPGTCDASNNNTSSGTVTATGTTFKFLATKSGWTNSGIVTGTAFTLTVADPSFGTNGGSFYNDTTSTQTSTTTGAVFCQTVDGTTTPAASTPGTCSVGTTGADATVIATGKTIKVLGTKANYVNSAVQTSSAFTLTVGAVTSSPGAGTYTTTQSVTLNIATTTGATVHYTTDGSAVSCSSATYPGAFNVSATTTVKAIGCKTNYVSDSAISDLYTIAVISVSITTSGTVSYGNLQFNTVKSTIDLGSTQTAKNDGNVAEDFTIKTSNATGGTGWTLGSSAGTNIFVHEFSSNSGSTWTKFAAADTYSATNLATNLAANGTQNFDLRITTPTSSDAVSKSITITILATQH